MLVGSIFRFLSKIRQFITSDACKYVENPLAWLGIFLFIRTIICVIFVFVDGRGIVPLEPSTYLSAGTDGYIQLAKTWLETGEYAFWAGQPPVHTRPPITPLLMKYFAAPFEQHWFVCWFLFTTILMAAVSLFFLIIIKKNVSNILIRRIILLAYLGFPPFVVVVRATTFLPIASSIVLVWAIFNLFIFNKNDLVYFLVWGVLTAIAALTHATLILLLPASLLSIGVQRKSLQRKIVLGLIFLGTF